MTKKYIRFADHSTSKSIKCAKKNLSKFGKLEKVILRAPRRHKQAMYNDKLWNRVYMHFDNCIVRFNALSWGYCGEGTRGLREVLKMVDFEISQEEIASIKTADGESYTIKA
jgi:hypothetical protein